MSNIILCADDSKTIQTVAEITFRVSDYQYVGAVSADEALDKARAQKPALILADASMPGKDGYELCQAIKSDPALGDVPVVMLCGNSSGYDASRGTEVGADGHVTKPWDTEAMLGKVAEILDKAGASQAPAPSAPAAVKTKPPILPTTPAAAANAAAAAASAPQGPRGATMMGMQPLQQPPGPAAESGGASARRGTEPAVEDARPLGAPLPPQRAATPAKPARPAGQRAPSRPAPAPGGRAATPPPASARPRPTPRPTAVGHAPTPGRTPAPPAVEFSAPAAKPAPAPMPAPTPAPAPAATKPAPAAAPAAAPARRRAEIVATPATGAPAIGRPPMIKGTPLRRPSLSALMQSAVPQAAASIARDNGIDPMGPEMKALVALSQDVVERIVWEVVPELAETIIRENLDLLTAKQ
ncbi:response regulator [Haliangium ochraceum]|uniref:Response regulator receiver protein n=1 Tax=Haliangium ochraceum (strain DSM 14365 / JCM 11303 / SMP-2) TaxID=502025 RepID=D0LW46_HALO1|nr:response regulator [Haliangium ochraceum]ACY15978.1 response regulator receiver protein [Haliangium ochraceum DSM 14365]